MIDAELSAALAARQRDGLYRRRLTLDSAQGPEVTVDGRRYLNFCSNDYLGLASHPAIAAALADASARCGTGSGASHLICGHHAEHEALEAELAAFVGRERALLFSTGYMANLGAVTALVGRGDRVFEDRLNHASLLDAGLLSGARFTRFAHADAADLDRRLAGAGAGRKLVAVDGVFSMDGDVAPLAELASVARRHNAWLMVDDAHGLGVLGPQGSGSVNAADLDTGAVPVLMGTLGKALGTAGAFVAGSEALIETLIQFARTYIYTTATPPALAAATRVALSIAGDEQWRRDRLETLIDRFRAGAEAAGLPLMPSTTAIQPIVVGDAGLAVEISEALRRDGILVVAIRPPTVPRGSARLRVTLSAAHGDDHVDQLIESLGGAWR